ncbi:MAG: hypothetical protein K2K21_17000 [Lachnospiraceae bacterium]|nr:hypothetical protein [Lachnospiraceae bacterium]
MKKWIYFLGMITCFLFCTISVRADLIWEPQDDFYEKHSSECTHVNRQFIADGPDGVVILYKSPESAEETATWENGYQTWISFTYEDEQGIVWGFPSELEEKSGWVPMEYMKVVYDSISFMEEHSSQIENRNGFLDESHKDDIIYLWKYPGSDGGSSVNMQNWENMPDYSSVYVDEEGRSWGYVGYFYGYRSLWICLDNPTAEYEELYPNGAPQYGVEDDKESKEGETQATENLSTERIKPQTHQRTIVVVITLMAAVVLITIVLLVMLKKQK